MQRRTFNREQIAWAAGFYEGEGSVTISNSSDGCQRLCLQIWQSSPECLVRFREVFGIGNLGGPYRNNSGWVKHNAPLKPKYCWHISGHQPVQAIIAMMWPWLSEVRRSRAVEMLRQFRAYESLPRYQRRRWRELLA